MREPIYYNIVMTDLFIVESATKRKIIQEYLNSAGYKIKVMASMGHILDLPVKTLGVNEVDFSVKYEPISKKSTLIKELKEASKNASIIYLASDADREGNAIAVHLTWVLGNKTYKRVLFNEITKTAIINAINNSVAIDMRLFQAQECRRVVDRLAGYKVSPLLWKQFNINKLSAGRVISVALKFIYDRVKLIKEHKGGVGWELLGDFIYNNITINAVYSNRFETFINGEQVANNVKQFEEWTIKSKESDVEKSPPPPFTTSTLQQNSPYSSKKTMSIAQSLYEIGAITYMRTDSLNISDEAIKNIEQFVTNKWGNNYSTPREYKTKTINAQEAHEAIRPTDVYKESINGTNEQIKLYKLIWNRTVASQMSVAVYSQFSYSVSANEHCFKGSISLIKEVGYQIVNSCKTDLELINKWRMFNSIVIPYKQFTVNPVVSNAKPLYTEGTFIKKMESSGVGRHSTFSSTIERLYKNGYTTMGEITGTVNAEKLTISKRDSIKTNEVIKTGSKGVIVTEIGEKVVTYLTETVPTLLNTDFTKNLEEELDLIAHGTVNKTEILSKFRDCLNEQLRNTKIDNKNEYIHNGVTYFIEKLKYGLVFYKEAKKRIYIGVDPYLEWKGKAEVDKDDIENLVKISKLKEPVKWGRYGLYIVKNGKNLKIDKALWGDYL